LSYSHKSVRDWLAVPEQQFRSWQSQLPNLVGRDGRRDRFNFGEVLALNIVAILVNDLGIRIGRIVSISEFLFGKCSGAPIEHWANMLCMVDLTTATCAIVDQAEIPPILSATIVVPMGPVVQDLFRRMTENGPEAQLSLDLLPPPDSD